MNFKGGQMKKLFAEVILNKDELRESNCFTTQILVNDFNLIYTILDLAQVHFTDSNDVSDYSLFQD